MGNLKAFFAQNAQAEITEDFVVSDRFKDEEGDPVKWKIRSLSEAENEQLRKASTNYVRGRGGQRMPQTDVEAYLARVVTSSVVFPNLKDAELQSSYSVMGAEELVKKMLLAGEYGRLLKKVQEVNGFDEDINEMVEDIKN